MLTAPLFLDVSATLLEKCGTTVTLRNASASATGLVFADEIAEAAEAGLTLTLPSAVSAAVAAVAASAGALVSIASTPAAGIAVVRAGLAGVALARAAARTAAACAAVA